MGITNSMRMYEGTRRRNQTIFLPLAEALQYERSIFK
jgi:hypothetical protein